ncbi:flavin reductase family protein [Oceanirhabdus seepicola]|uniref:Flavin reductase family protein n=1 Tax=Oceanirhabdus seepicola TaxID=2828781 RepID=A0A9J6P7L0_9CLOT|nr:flavin reductase family protein [Oceanirhabdus seepicola]MCM1991805.1 flavin reductase family protein [Oceanirhabdus seepicola]
MKKSVGANTMILPLPSVVVGTYDNDNNANMMTAAWTGIVNSSPTMISVSLRKATYSYSNIIDKQAFTICIPSKKHVLEMDYVGTVSGRIENKFEKTGLTSVKSEVVDAPYVSEFPVVLECKLVKYDDLGLHTMFIGEVIDVKIDKDCLKENGMPDILKIDPISYMHGDREYFGTGEYLGRANRMWQTSLLNDNTMSDYEKEILELILDYYNKIDNHEPIEELKEFFYWNDVDIILGPILIDSFEKYSDWYKDNNNTCFDGKHIIEKFEVDKLNEKEFIARMDVYHRAKTWEKGQAKSKRVHTKVKVECIFIKDKTANTLKMKKYNVILN